MKACIVAPCRLVDENLLNITIRFLDSIDKRTIYSNYEVLIYDNNSEPSLTERLIKYVDTLNNKDRFRVIVLGKYKFNLAQIQNMSVRDSDADIFVFFNNDQEVLNAEWLGNLVQWYKEVHNLGMCVPFHDFAGDPFKAVPKHTIVDSGENATSVYSMQRKVIDAIGGFDERFDLYYQDFDVQKCVRSKGYIVRWVNDVIVKHYGERTTILHSKVESYDAVSAYELLKNKKYE